MDGEDVEEWLHDMFEKVGGVWSDVCGNLRQAETVNYVESRVQTIGTDVKSFCSEFIQEVFSSSPAQTTTDRVDDIPLVQITETMRHIDLTEGVSDEIPSVEMPGKIIEECVSVKEELSEDAIVPAGSFDDPSCQSPLTDEDLSEDDLVLPGCQPEASTSDLEGSKISTSFSERDCEDEECLDIPNRCARGTDHPVLKGLLVTNNPGGASSSELLDASAGNSELSECDYTGSGSSKEGVKRGALLQGGDETMLGESCIMIHSSDSCPDKHQSTKQRADVKKLLRKFCLRMSEVNDRDSRPEPNTDKSCGDFRSTRRLEMLPLQLDTVASTPLPREVELIEQDWEII